MFRLFKKKEYMEFKEFTKRLSQRARVLSNSDDCKESTKNLIDNNQDFYGMIKR